jgi:glucan 1,3-beta-glucosidase
MFLFPSTLRRLLKRLPDKQGHCASAGVTPTEPFDGTYLPWQTGGAGAGTINAADQAEFGTWPPASIGLEADAAALPTYTATGAVPTLPPPTFTALSPRVTVDAGDGWFNDADTARGVTTVAGCTYPNPWDATAAAVPAVCTGA